MLNIDTRREGKAAQEEDAAGLRAGRAYDKGVKESEE
jgi:hypothetical protein